MPRTPVTERVITVLADWFNECGDSARVWGEGEMYQDAAGLLLDILDFWHSGELPDEYKEHQ